MKELFSVLGRMLLSILPCLAVIGFVCALYFSGGLGTIIKGLVTFCLGR